MKTLKNFVFLTMMSILLFHSCKKDEFVFHAKNAIAIEENYPAIISGNGTYDEDTIPVPTILGTIRNNPYSVSNMIRAWNNLNPLHQITNLAPTDLYVKFTPQSEEEYKLLADTKENFYDYPLEKELITLGDYYPQDGRQFPELWAIVDPAFISPISEYTIVNELFIPRYNTYLTEEAFSLTSNEYDNEGDPMFIQVGDNIQSLVAPRYPDDGGDGGGGGNGGGAGGGGSDPNYTTNSCGCVVFSDHRKPGGCIKVKDVEHSQFEGVRHVKIITKDTWFTEDETETDDNGCWRIDNRYHGKMWMWVKFIGPVCQIRGVKDGLNYVLGWSHPMKDYLGKVRNGPPYNNVEVKYDIWVNRGSQAHMHWAASTINNAIHDFNGYAGSEGINNPPFLDIFEIGNRSDGVTLMANYLPLQLVPPGLIGWFIPNFVKNQLPDISIGAEFHNSDQLKEITYHETSHASHFTKAGPQFWLEVENAEENGILLHGGNPYHQVGGIVDLAESWAYHVGWFFADKHYPVKFSRYWESYLADYRNHENGHMPSGVFYDLKDNLPNGIQYKSDYCCGGSYPINDRVQSYNCSQMFDLMTSNTQSPTDFYTKFKSNFGNNDPILIQKMNDLFNSY